MTRVFRHDPIDFRSMPPAIKTLIALNAAVFVIQSLGYPLIPKLGLIPERVAQWPLPEFWRLATYLFLHGGFFHLLFNLFALWMFGMPVESQWGGREFVKYYFLCGVGGALATVATSFALHQNPLIPVIGASGPVYGLLVAFAMLYPDAVIYLYFLIPMKAAHFALLFGAIEFFLGASSATPGVARFAHLGGMITGYLYIRWWRIWKLKFKTFIAGLLSRDEEEACAPRPARRAARSVSASEEDQMTEVDRVLDKILASGLESLTEGERAIMRRYAQRQKGFQS
ncbi:MAG TPA: DUF1751 domain-containing protein [Elusimicrobia bacterium]|nr:DUF1751 domain-containing protein [Elusimicrobiota bacterium]